MKFVLLCDEDFSGQMYNLCSFINKTTDHKATMVSNVLSPYKYPSIIIKTSSNLKKIQQTVYTGDVVVFFESSRLFREFGLNKKHLHGKTIIVLLGGYGFRNPYQRALNSLTYNPLSRIRDIKLKWVSISLDFLNPNWIEHPSWNHPNYKKWANKIPVSMKNMEWIPPCIRMKELRKNYDFSKLSPPIIATSPSKSTNKQLGIRKDFDFMVSNLGSRKFKTDIISEVSNEECLKRKAHASIFFDRIFMIYGVNSQEAGAFESAVVTGSSKFVLNRLQKEGFNCPFVIVNNAEEGRDAVAKLLDDSKYCRQKGKECFRHVKKLHSGAETVRRLIKIVEE